jgi:hypothetical protein
MSYFMKIRPVGAELFHMDGHRQTDMMQLTVTFCNFGNTPKMDDANPIKNSPKYRKSSGPKLT